MSCSPRRPHWRTDSRYQGHGWLWSLPLKTLQHVGNSHVNLLSSPSWTFCFSQLSAMANPEHSAHVLDTCTLLTWQPRLPLLPWDPLPNASHESLARRSFFSQLPWHFLSMLPFSMALITCTLALQICLSSYLSTSILGFHEGRGPCLITIIAIYQAHTMTLTFVHAFFSKHIISSWVGIIILILQMEAFQWREVQ